MVTTPALAQRTGDSARVTVGTVESAAPVQLQSDSGRNALIGGAVGWALARNRSSGTQAAAALGGAALGGAGTAASEGTEYSHAVHDPHQRGFCHTGNH